MPNLSIKNVPEAIVEKLRQRAAANHRSLQGELMLLVCAAAVCASLNVLSHLLVVANVIRSASVVSILIGVGFDEAFIAQAQTVGTPFLWSSPYHRHQHSQSH